MSEFTTQGSIRLVPGLWSETFDLLGVSRTNAESNLVHWAGRLLPDLRERVADAVEWRGELHPLTVERLADGALDGLDDIAQEIITAVAATLARRLRPALEHVARGELQRKIPRDVRAVADVLHDRLVVAFEDAGIEVDDCALDVADVFAKHLHAGEPLELAIEAAVHTVGQCHPDASVHHVEALITTATRASTPDA